jgi:hypothetical protein
MKAGLYLKQKSRGSAQPLEPGIRDYRNAFLLQGVSSLGYTRPPGRPSKLTPSQRRELAALIKAGPQAAGDTSGCWHTPMIRSSYPKI